MRQSWFRWARAFALLALGSIGACAGDGPTKTGSETNWLKDCASDGDCEDGACWCGVCTSLCASDGDCAALGGAACSLPESTSYAEQCAGAATPPGGLCLPTCSSAELCPEGQMCFGGLCIDTDRTEATFETLGQACFVADETQDDFTSFAVTEVNIYEIAPECGSGECVVDHFQGRVSCPYGQTEAELSLPADDPARCRVTDEAGNVTSDPVTVQVEPQLVSRPPEVAVACACRCSGADVPEQELCACPEGFECRPLFREIGNGQSGLTASYCRPPGTEFDPTVPRDTTTCDKNGSDPATDCGNGRVNP